jgi:hypothetical protein
VLTTILRPISGLVGLAGHACGAHVVPVGHLVLNSLHDSDFSGRAVVVVDWPVRAAADTAIQRSE